MIPDNVRKWVEQEIQSLEAQLEALRVLLPVTTSKVANGRRKRKGMSAVQRAAVSRRMKAFWAKRKGARKGTTSRKARASSSDSARSSLGSSTAPTE